MKYFKSEHESGAYLIKIEDLTEIEIKKNESGYLFWLLNNEKVKTAMQIPAKSIDEAIELFITNYIIEL